MSGLRLWFLALAPRERWLALLTIAVVSFGVIDSWVTAPLRADNARLRAAVETHSAELAGLQNNVMRRQAELQRDPDAGLKRRRSQLQAEIADLGSRSRLQANERLLAPEKASSVVKYLLRSAGALELERLDKLSPVATMLAGEARPGQEILFRHSVVLKLKGSYPELERYVDGLARRFPGLVFDSMNLQAATYPFNQVELQLAILTHAESLWND